MLSALQIAFPLVCAGLGTWQVARHFEKQDLVSQIQTAIDAKPRPLNSIKELEAADYHQRWEISGPSLSEPVLVGPRGITVNGHTGYGSFVFEAVQLSSG